MSPPVYVVPAPTLTSTSPPLPFVARPVATLISPLMPLLVVPVENDSNDDVPFVPEFDV